MTMMLPVVALITLQMSQGGTLPLLHGPQAYKKVPKKSPKDSPKKPLKESPKESAMESARKSAVHSRPPLTVPT